MTTTKMDQNKNVTCHTCKPNEDYRSLKISQAYGVKMHVTTKGLLSVERPLDKHRIYEYNFCCTCF